jgi:hypothetical protein
MATSIGNEPKSGFICKVAGCTHRHEIFETARSLRVHMRFKHGKVCADKDLLKSNWNGVGEPVLFNTRSSTPKERKRKPAQVSRIRSMAEEFAAPARQKRNLRIPTAQIKIRHCPCCGINLHEAGIELATATASESE